MFTDDSGPTFATLEGCGVRKEGRITRSDGGRIDWDPTWPAGSYTLDLVQLDKRLARQTFEVRRVPRADGNTQAIIVPEVDPAPMRMAGGEARTVVPISVVRPVLAFQFIWVVNHEAVPPRRDDRTMLLTTPQLFQLSELGSRQIIGSRAPDDVDLAGGTLYVFESGDTLIGTWRYLAAPAGEAVDLPVATPVPKDLAVARAAAAERVRWAFRNIPDMNARVDEPIACAVATIKDARDAYAKWAREAMEESMGVSTQLAKQDQAENPMLSKAQRRRLQADREQSGRMTVLAGTAKQRAAAQIKSFARKFKPGCLADLGIPTPRPAKKS